MMSIHTYLGSLVALLVFGTGASLAPAQSEQVANDVFEHTAYGVFLSGGLGWADGTKMTRNAIAPDALLFENSGDGARQIKAGKGVFVPSLVPIEFEVWISPLAHDLVVATADRSATIEQCLGHAVWLDSGLAKSGVGTLKVKQIELAGDGWRKPWQSALQSQGPVTIQSKQSIHLRIALTLSERELEKAFGGDRSKVPMRLALYFDPSKIEGNQALVEALKKSRGSSPYLYFHSVPFTLVAEKAFGDSADMKIAYALWKLRKAPQDGPARWSAFDELLKMQPKNEAALLDYARSLERAGRLPQAIQTVDRLIETVKIRPKTTHQLHGINPFQLIPTSDGHMHGHKGEMSNEQLVLMLNRHRQRLESKVKVRRSKKDEQ